MEETKDTITTFLAQNEAALNRLREVGLREFEKGVDGLRLIVQEFESMQSMAVEHGLLVLAACLGDIHAALQGWLADPIFTEQLPTLASAWSDVVCEILNYFAFLGQEDESDLRERVNYRLLQLAKASAALVPAPAPAEDGSWGLFEESPAPLPVPEAAVAPAPAVTPAPLKTVEPPSDSLLATHYLICLLGSQQYALPIHQVREILEQRQEKALPSQRSGIRGLVTVRGLVCPVVDVSHILHTKDDVTSEEERKKRCMVVCEVDRRTFCFNVDDVKQVAAVDEFDDPITPLNPESSVQKAISHVSHFQNKSVLFVKMREVIPA